MNRLALHIGAHKTGTSLLQKYMRDNARPLERNHITYISRSDMNDYFGWGKPLIETPELFLSRVAREADDHPDNVIVASHENTLGKPMVPGKADLYPEAGRRIEALAKVAVEYDTNVIFYIRPQAGFVESYYLQLVHQGSFEPFHDWFSQFDIRELSWQPLIEDLRAAIGRDRVSIVDFGEISDGQNVFIEKFMRRVQPSFAGKVDYKPNRNRSISDLGLRIALAANPHLKTGEERSKMRKFLQKHYSNVDYPRPDLLSEQQKEQLSELYKSEFQGL